MKGGVASIVALESGKEGMFGNRALGAQVSGSGGAPPNSEGTGMRGAGPRMSELGLSKMGSVVMSSESFFADFMKPRNPFFFIVVALGGGVAGTSSAVLSFCAAGNFSESLFSLVLSFFGFCSDESSSSFSLLPLVLSLPTFSLV